MDKKTLLVDVPNYAGMKGYFEGTLLAMIEMAAGLHNVTKRTDTQVTDSKGDISVSITVYQDGRINLYREYYNATKDG